MPFRPVRLGPRRVQPGGRRGGRGPHKPKSGRPVWVGWVTTAGDRRQSRPEQVASDGAGQEELCQPHSGAQAGGLPTLSELQERGAPNHRRGRGGCLVSLFQTC